MTAPRKPLTLAEHNAKTLADAQASSTDVAHRLDRLVKRSLNSFLENPEVEALVLQVYEGATRSLRAVETRNAFAAKMVGLVASFRLDRLEELEREHAVDVALAAFPRGLV